MSNWNTNPYLKWGLTLFLFLIGAYFMLKSYGYADHPTPCCQEYLYQTYESRTNYQGTPSWEPRTETSIKNQRKEWQQAYDFHHMNAVRTYTDAYNRVWFLPDIELRQLARDAWVAACATAGGSTITGRLVSAFATLLCNYGLHCLDEWEYIQDKLAWSKFHFEKCEYYASLLQN